MCRGCKVFVYFRFEENVYKGIYLEMKNWLAIYIYLKLKAKSYCYIVVHSLIALIVTKHTRNIMVLFICF